MKNTLITLAAIAVSSSALAADLPRRTAPPAPAFTQASQTGFYAGVNGGVAWSNTNDGKGVAGVTVGYAFNQFLRAEVNGINRFGSNDAQSVTADAILGVPVGAFTPYALVGVGAGFNGFNSSNRDAQAIWSVGGGVRYAVNRNWEVDARYRYVQNFDNNLRDNNVATLGLTYKF